LRTAACVGLRARFGFTLILLVVAVSPQVRPSKAAVSQHMRGGEAYANPTRVRAVVPPGGFGLAGRLTARPGGLRRGEASLSTLTPRTLPGARPQPLHCRRGPTSPIGPTPLRC